MKVLSLIFALILACVGFVFFDLEEFHEYRPIPHMLCEVFGAMCFTWIGRIAQSNGW